MTPKEKAQELVEKFYKANQPQTFDIRPAKQCAIIAVDEIIKSLYRSSPIDQKFEQPYIDYWQEVKSEIEKL